MTPNSDMSNPQAQEESFTLANIVPQDPCNNEVLWEGVESAIRAVALGEGEVFVVTGPAFIGAELDSLKGRVMVPTHIPRGMKQALTGRRTTTPRIGKPFQCRGFET